MSGSDHPGIRLPQDWELIGFFEAEPILADKSNDYGWQYNTLTFVTGRGEDEVTCTIQPSYGELAIAWARSGKKLVELNTVFAERIRLEKEGDAERMRVDYLESTKLLELVLQLKPTISITWGISRWERTYWEHA